MKSNCEPSMLFHQPVGETSRGRLGWTRKSTVRRMKNERNLIYMDGSNKSTRLNSRIGNVKGKYNRRNFKFSRAVLLKKEKAEMQFLQRKW